MDTGSGGGGSDTVRPAHIEPYAQALIRPTTAGERDTDQLPEPLAGAFVDTDDSHLSGARAGLDGGLAVVP